MGDPGVHAVLGTGATLGEVGAGVAAGVGDLAEAGSRGR